MYKLRYLGLCVLITFSVVAAARTSHITFACPAGWDMIGTHCYNFVNITVDFEDARDVCNKYGAQLLVIRDEVEAKDVSSVAVQKFNTSKSFWIYNGRYEQDSGKGSLHSTFCKGMWQPNEPRETNEDVGIASNMQGRWALSWVWSNLPFICRAPACPTGSFRCSDGTCLNVRWKCDGAYDCKDMSDENDCSDGVKYYTHSTGTVDTSSITNSGFFYQWIIEGEPGEVLQIEFETLAIEDHVDNVRVYSGGPSIVTSELIRDITTSSTKQLSVFSKNHFVIVTFQLYTSKNQHVKFNWKPDNEASWKQVQIVDVTNSDSSISSPYYNSSMAPVSFKREWLLRAPKGEVITLEVLDNTLELNASSDFYIVTNVGFVLKELNSHKAIYISSTNSMSVIIKTRSLKKNFSFSARHRKGCDFVTNLTLASFTLKNLPANLSCIWTMQNKVATNFRLQINETFITNSSDVLQIYNGSIVRILNHSTTGIKEYESVPSDFSIKYVSDIFHSGIEFSGKISAGCQDFQNGKMNLFYSNTSVGELYKAQLSCPEGFRFKQEEYSNSRTFFAVCKEGGIWDWGSPGYTRTPECQIVYCGFPPPIPNGFVNSINGNSTYKSVASYQCFSGFEIKGSSNVTCQADGNWSVTPSCIDINECSNSGAKICTDNENCVNLVGSYICICKNGFTGADCTTTVCSNASLPPLNHGKIESCTGNGNNMKCVAVCDKGYLFQSTSNSTSYSCVNGKWDLDFSELSCTTTICSNTSLPPLNHGRIESCTGNGNNMKCVAVCDKGYLFQSTSNSTSYSCVNGKWDLDFSELSCTKMSDSAYDYNVTLQFNMSGSKLPPSPQYDAYKCLSTHYILLSKQVQNISACGYHSFTATDIIRHREIGLTSDEISFTLHVLTTDRNETNLRKCAATLQNQSVTLFGPTYPVTGSMSCYSPWNVIPNTATIVPNNFSCIQSTKMVVLNGIKYCLPCGLGTFYNYTIGQCQQCQDGYYQDEEGQAACKMCPNGVLKSHVPRTQDSHCFDPCSPGEYSITGHEPCSVCPMNFYSINQGERTCTECPSNTSTAGNGSKSSSACLSAKSMCTPNFCNPVGTMNTSKCEILDHRPVCYCKPEYSGKACELEKDYCADDPCNGGICTLSNLTYVCDCRNVKNYGGENCNETNTICSTCPNSTTCQEFEDQDGYLKPACMCLANETLVGDTCKTVNRDYDLVFLESFANKRTFLTSESGFYLDKNTNLSITMWVAAAKQLDSDQFIISLRSSKMNYPFLSVFNTRVQVTTNINISVELTEDIGIKHSLDESFTWHCIDIGWSTNGNFEIWFDFLLLIQTNLLASPPSDEFVFVQLGQSFYGYISQVSVWKTALTPDDHYKIFNNKLAVPQPDSLLLGWTQYSFDSSVRRTKTSTAAGYVYICDITDTIALMELNSPECKNTNFIDKTPPEVNYCNESMLLPTDYSKHQVSSSELGYTFRDDTDGSLSSEGQLFSYGAYDVAVSAEDSAGNIGVCMTRAYITPNRCGDTEPPQGYLANCSDNKNGKRVTCPPGMLPSIPTPNFVSCSNLLTYNLDDLYEKPDTIVCGVGKPFSVTVNMVLPYRIVVNCNDQVILSISEHIIAAMWTLNTSWRGLCRDNNCSNVEPSGYCTGSRSLEAHIQISGLNETLNSPGHPPMTPLEIMTISVAHGDTFNFSRVADAHLENKIQLDEIAVCDKGYSVSGIYCVQCGPGSYYDEGEMKCKLCERNTYSDQPGSISCTACQPNKVTLQRGSASITDCKEKCQFGHMLSLTTGTCIPCPKNFYQDREGKSYCFPCPPATGTENNGTTSQVDCIVY